MRSNMLVLALHAMACVAGFIAGSSLPLQAGSHSGLSRWVHEHGGKIAIAFVVGATTFSLSAQAYVIGHTLAGVSHFLHVSPAILLLGVLPHAVPELIALFLPLAAWILASRRGAWEELLAATVVTVAIAIPVLVVAALVEVYVSPHLFTALTHIHPPIIRASEGWIVKVNERGSVREAVVVGGGLPGHLARLAAVLLVLLLLLFAFAGRLTAVEHEQQHQRDRDRDRDDQQTAAGYAEGDHVLHFV